MCIVSVFRVISLTEVDLFIKRDGRIFYGILKTTKAFSFDLMIMIPVSGWNYVRHMLRLLH